MGEKKEKVVTKSAAQHLRERGGQEKPVYAAVKTGYFCREPYRAVLLKNIKDDGTITIKQKVMIKDFRTGRDVEQEKDIIYRKIVIIEPSTNAQDIRNFCEQRNREVQRNIDRMEKQKEQERLRAEREREDARRREREETARKLQPMMREIAIWRNKMDEVATGEQRLPHHMTLITPAIKKSS